MPPPPPAPRADLTRARAALAGDESAFREIFDHVFPRLYRFACARTADSGLAEEAVQATLCAAFERLASYRGEASLLTWMTTILRRELSARLARSGREQPLPPDATAWLETIATLDGITGETERAELAARVHQVLDWLPAADAQLLNWKYFEELPVAEIATRLGVGLKAAESRLHRARLAFRDEFSTLVRLTPGAEGAL
jgi:RNA polymerase sigma-70 factor (ECF subfamily)